MSGHEHGVFDYWPRQRVVGDLGVVVLWIVFVVSTIYTYPNVPFILPTVVGALCGIGYTYWLRRTDSGQFLDDAYRHARVGYKIGLAIAIVVVFYLTTVFFYSVLDNVPWIMVTIGWCGWILAYRQTDSSLLSARIR